MKLLKMQLPIYFSEKTEDAFIKRDNHFHYIGKWKTDFFKYYDEDFQKECSDKCRKELHKDNEPIPRIFNCCWGKGGITGPYHSNDESCEKWKYEQSIKDNE